MNACDVKEDEKKFDYLLVLGGMELQEAYDKVDKYDVLLSINDGPSVLSCYESAKETLERHFAPMENKRYERRQLRKIQQEREEKFEEFVFRIQKQAKKCQ